MRNRGIALILAVGVLAIVAVIATSFALNMRLEYHAAMNYYNGVKARYFAESALERAIAELRTHVKSSAFDDLDEDWALTTHPTNTSSLYNNHNIIAADIAATPPRITSNGSSYVVLSRDEQRKVNINTATATLLGNLLTEYAVTDAAGAANNILGQRGSGYKDIRELRKRVADLKDENEFNKIKDHITTNSYIDSNTSRAPINVNTADQEVLAAVIMGIANTSSTEIPVTVSAISQSDAIQVANKLVADRPFNTWSEFNDAVDDAEVTVGQATVIKYNCNPNRPKPTDYTTELCFNSGGYYEIVARGTVTDFLGFTQADRTLSAVVKIYDIYSETTKAQFELGTPQKVTWLDSCPVRSDQVFGVYEIPSNAEKINDSLKLGFWDDFNDDADGGDRAYSKKHWKRNLSTYASDSDFNNGRLITLGGVRFDLYGTDGTYEWDWGDFALRVFADEYNIVGVTQIKDVAWVLFRKNDTSVTAENYPAVIHARQDTLSWGDDKYGYLNLWDLNGKVAFMTIDEILNSASSPYPDYRTMYNLTTAAYPVEADRIQAAINARYKYDRDGSNGQIRILTLYKAGSGNPSNPEWENYDVTKGGWEWLKKDLAYTQTKTFNIRTNPNGTESKEIEATVITSTDSATLNRTLIESGVAHDGRAVLYANNVSVAWDDMRIIPREDITWPPNFISQSLDSSKINGLATSGVEWGTITGTLTLPQEPTWDAGDQFKWRFWTKVVGIAGPPDLAYPPENVIMGTSYFVVNGGTGTANTNLQWSNITFDDSPTYAGDRKASIQYRVDLQTTNTKKAPILEDITITYLPKVSIKSYSVSQ